MNYETTQLMLRQYPDYHNQPLFLTCNEIEHPEEVIIEFFSRYTLPQLRKLLGEIRNMALLTQVEGADFSSLILTLEDLIRLAEANNLIVKRKLEFLTY